MPDQTISPHQAAQQIGVSVHTVRRWCKDHAPYLSPGASPDRGAMRRLTVRDVEVLQEVSRLRTVEGLTTVQINERLAGLVFNEQTAIEPAQAAQGAPGTQESALMVLRDVVTPLAARVEALEAQRQRLDVAYLVVMAFVAGLIVGLAVWWFQ
jgi:DNA-binding transcriptional MerR regulator